MSEEQELPVHLTVEAMRDDRSPLVLRQRMFEAKGDLYTIEGSVSATGSVVIIVKEEGKKGWVAYTLTPAALAAAVLAEENSMVCSKGDSA